MSRALVFLVVGLAVLDLTEAAAGDKWEALGGLRTASLLVAFGLVVAIWRRCASGVRLVDWFWSVIALIGAGIVVAKEWNHNYFETGGGKHVSFRSPVSTVVNESESFDGFECESESESELSEDLSPLSSPLSSPTLGISHMATEPTPNRMRTTPRETFRESVREILHEKATTSEPAVANPDTRRHSWPNGDASELSQFSFTHILGSEARQISDDPDRVPELLSSEEIRTFIEKHAPTLEELVATFSDRADRLKEKILLMDTATTGIVVKSGRLYLQDAPST